MKLFSENIIISKYKTGCNVVVFNSNGSDKIIQYHMGYYFIIDWDY